MLDDAQFFRLVFLQKFFMGLTKERLSTADSEITSFILLSTEIFPNSKCHVLVFVKTSVCWGNTYARMLLKTCGRIVSNFQNSPYRIFSIENYNRKYPDNTLSNILITKTYFSSLSTFLASSGRGLKFCENF